MNEDELRIKIYEYLGLEVGSLASESGNDWERAKKEVLDDVRRESGVQDNTSNCSVESHSIDELIANNKLDILYQTASKNLSEPDFRKLVDLNDKDIFIRIASNTAITDSIAEKLIGTVYLAHKSLLKNDSVGHGIKEQLLDYMKNKPNMYTDLINQYNNSKN